MTSVPGMCGKPRKFTWLSNFDLQTAKVLRHPAVTVAVSPIATGNGVGNHNLEQVDAARCAGATSASKMSPSLPPDVKRSVPPENQSFA